MSLMRHAVKTMKNLNPNQCKTTLGCENARERNVARKTLDVRAININNTVHNAEAKETTMKGQRI